MTPAGAEPDGATPLDPDELEGLRHQHITSRAELNHLEQANIQSGLAWLKRRRSADSLTEAFIRDLHRRLFGEVWRWAGSFRLTEKNIGVDPVQIHLFANGNGRHARIAADQYLRWDWGHPPIDWAAGYDLEGSSERRKAYIRALRAADAGDYRSLFWFVGLGL